MTQWSYVIVAYAVMLVGMAGLIVSSLGAMRRSEALAEDLRRR